MPRTAHTKHDRGHLQREAKTKRTLERAAAYAGTSVSSFVLANAAQAAERVIQERERVTLSAADWDMFYDALTDPPEPTERLSAAARRHHGSAGR